LQVASAKVRDNNERDTANPIMGPLQWGSLFHHPPAEARPAAAVL
jgi:hypothetical protein